MMFLERTLFLEFAKTFIDTSSLDATNRMLILT